MAEKRYLNVQHGGRKEEVDITGTGRLGGVKERIKSICFQHSPVEVIDIELWDEGETTKFNDLDDIPDNYYAKVKHGGRYLVIKLSRQGLIY